MAPPSSSDRWLELSVLDVLSRWPASARLFLRYRMVCIGCDFSRFDRLGEALAVHGPYLGHVDHTGTQQVPLSPFELHVARHLRQHEIRGDRGDDDRMNGAPIEAVMLYDDRGSPP